MTPRVGQPRVVRRAARAILVDDGRLVLIRRTRPGRPAYWTTPGGGIEARDPSPEAATLRELREELGAEADIGQQVFLVTEPAQGGVAVHYFFVCRLRHLDLGRRCGPEFSADDRGSYDVDRVAPNADGTLPVDLKPNAVKAFIEANWTTLLDLAADATASQSTHSHARAAGTLAPPVPVAPAADADSQPQNDSVRALLITGTVGSGKTTVAEALGNHLARIKIANAVIDVDWLRRMEPHPPNNRFNNTIALRNLRAVAHNYVEHGVLRLILAGVVESRASRDAYQAALGVPLTVCRLRVALPTVRQRLTRIRG